LQNTNSALLEVAQLSKVRCDAVTEKLHKTYGNLFEAVQKAELRKQKDIPEELWPGR
jgi:hypothetical protein